MPGARVELDNLVAASVHTDPQDNTAFLTELPKYPPLVEDILFSELEARQIKPGLEILQPELK